MNMNLKLDAEKLVLYIENIKNKCDNLSYRIMYLEKRMEQYENFMSKYNPAKYNIYSTGTGTGNTNW